MSLKQTTRWQYLTMSQKSLFFLYIVQILRITGQMCKLDQSQHYFMCCSVCIGMLFVNVCQGRHCCAVIYHLTAFYHSSPADSKL